MGAAVKRVEDPRFIRGEGTYLPNQHLPGELWMGVVRSPLPHGTITDIDVSQAKANPEVVEVFLASDLQVPGIASIASDAHPSTTRPLLAEDRVRFVGEPVALVIATNEAAVMDAVSEVWVDIDPLPSVVDPRQALLHDAPLLFPETGTNRVLTGGTEADPGVLEDAEVVVKSEFYNQRLAAVPLEPNSTVAIPTDDGLDVWTGSQNVFFHQRDIARTLGLDRNQVRVCVPDLGGGFGAKILPYPEQLLTAVVAHRLGKPVRWHERRTENMMGMCQGRDQYQTVELGARADGTLTGIRARLVQNCGAYTHIGAFLPHWTHTMGTGPYLIPRAEITWQSVVTNTTPIHAYRGAGRPEATAMLERIMDLMAARLGRDPVELRSQNFVSPEQFPYQTATGARYDSGDYQLALDRAVDLSDYSNQRTAQQQRRERKDGWQLGIGVSSYVEITAPDARKEWGQTEVGQDGQITVRTGISSHGQGHFTSLAQITAQLLGVPLEQVTVVQGDTDLIERGGGTMGSRSLQLGGSAVLQTGEEVLEKARRIVAHRLEADPADVVLFEQGGVGIRGVPDSGLSWSEIAVTATDPAQLPAGMEPGLEAVVHLEQAEPTVPFGTHISIVEVDSETGDVRLLDHVAVDDCGTILNRILVDGQVHGGVAQGIGQARFEQVRYDPEGYPLTTNLTTYLIPAAAEMPQIKAEHTITPSPENPLGVKGIGEAGTIGSTAAIQNAILDALSPCGIDHLDMPITPDKIWAAIQTGR